MLDSSSTVGEENFRTMLEFLVGVLETADVDSGAVRVGVMSFSSDVMIHFHLNQYGRRVPLLDDILNIPYRQGGTNTADGLQTLRSVMFHVAHGDRPHVPDVAIIVTDGTSNLNSERTIPEAVATHAAGIRVLVVAVGVRADTPEIQALATPPAEDYTIAVHTFDDLLGYRMQQTSFSRLCESTYRSDCLAGCHLLTVTVIWIRFQTAYDIIWSRNVC